ncbi:hypothetical protein [Acidiphilium angustum]|uniref:hypothetical protein n=1 Tax=Acidiphilium angustum TaxID=523 RepID=UPI0004949CF6|nr:hypothetical protein [Acidiphilium angustum]
MLTVLGFAMVLYYPLEILIKHGEEPDPFMAWAEHAPLQKFAFARASILCGILLISTAFLP